MAVVSHYNIQPAIDIYGAVEGRDLGGVARDIEPIIDEARKDLPRGSQIIVSRPDSDDELVVRRPARRDWAFRFCSSIC